MIRVQPVGPKKMFEFERAVVFRLNQYRGTEEIRKLFLRFDQLRSGRCSSQELFSVLCSVGVALTDEELEVFIDHYDTDGNRCVDYNELSRTIDVHRDTVHTINSVVYTKAILGHEVDPEAAERARCSLDPVVRLHLLIDNIQQLVAEKTSRDHTIADFFSDFDVDSSGRLSALQVSHILYDVGLTVPQEEVQVLLGPNDLEDDGLDYKEFVTLIEGPNPMPNEQQRVRQGITFMELSKATSSTGAPYGVMEYMVPATSAVGQFTSSKTKVRILEDASAAEALGAIRDMVHARMGALQSALNRADRNNSRVLDTGGFLGILAELGYELSSEDADVLVAYLSDEQGQVQYQGLVSALGGACNDSESENKQDIVIEKLNKVVYEDLRTLYDAFKKFDRDCTQHISLGEFVHLMDRNGVAITYDAAARLFQHVGAGTNGLCYSDFVNLLISSSHMKQ